MEGIVSLLKPPGMTSSNAVYDIRRLFGVKHAGHLGTLDPGAAGVLPICLGRAAKLFDLLVDKEKTYIAEITFGTATDTLDVYGKVLSKEPETTVSLAAFSEAIASFKGRTEQIAPAFSALKVDGKKMYDLARAGQEVPERIREIEISGISVLRQITANRFLFQVSCSRGTYIRTLCADIGAALGVPAFMSLLIRTDSGPFSLADSYTVQELSALKEEGKLETAVISCEKALMHLPEIRLRPDRKGPTINGLPTTMSKMPDGYYRAYSDGFLGLGVVKDHEFRLDVHLY